MFLRLLLALALGYLGYRVYRAVRQSLGLGGPPAQGPESGQPDVLVQDPVCQTFIPKKEALKIHKDGRDYFFCSEGCLKRFQRGGPA
jgi:YHS domain-containing protein